MSEPMILVEGLMKSFRRPRTWSSLLRRAPRKRVLESIELTIERGEIFGLLGPNGAGKTTLIKILSGLILPDAGRVVVNGYNLAQNSIAVRRSIGVIYGDERTFYWRLSVRENLLFYARLYGLEGRAADVKIAELLELVGLADVGKMRMHSFSSGMKQRAAIARGLIHDPRVIFMDEPARSLDPIGADDLHQLIRERVVDSNRTVLIATHLMNEAESLCHRLTMIDHGNVVRTGTVAEFRAAINTEVRYRLQVRSRDNGWQRGLGLIPGVISAEVTDAGGDLHDLDLALTRDLAALSTTIRYLAQHCDYIVACTKQEPSLDEVFRKVIRGRREAGRVPVLEATS